MTSTNVSNLGQMNATISLGSGGLGKTSKEAEEVTSVFSAMMYQNTQYNVGEAENVTDKVLEVDAAQEFDRFQYKENTVEEQPENIVTDNVEDVQEELEQFSDDVVEVISNELGIAKEQVVVALEELNMTAFDLLNPQNLAEIVMHIQGITDNAQLLTSANFQNLMKEIVQMGNDLMKQLDLNISQIDEIVLQMETFDSFDSIDNSTQDTIEFVKVQDDVEMTQTVQDADAIEVSDAVNDNVEVIVDDIPDQKVEVLQRDEMDVEVSNDKISHTEVQNHMTNGESKKDFSEERDNNTFANARDFYPTSTESTLISSNFGMEAQDVVSVPTDNGSYVSVNTLDIIRQVAENVKIVLANDFSSMEMQLNPENLGKVYLNVTVEEGAVNAQIAVQNETVKEVLEVQLATLRETLNQSGIKVDAVEVTVASHEFESNLEQDGRRQEEQAEKQHGNVIRRNISLDSLDELSGLMSEEETLVAKMMRDNGNSVDFTA